MKVDKKRCDTMINNILLGRYDKGFGQEAFIKSSLNEKERKYVDAEVKFMRESLAKRV